ncbi:cytochrome C [Falsiroseomonas bella]|uniref:Cytochrome C n=1 Tax=Falsiroseomonas bella TaxID=2184016 RepID=A0A317FDW8_9PROT|nr:c-type cytochrome [Falsiroseomonas bella]PWS37075.1 cytochrome C [Falsiroseomonas bella]
MRRRAFATAALLALLLLAGCGPGDVGESKVLVEGDPASGRRIIARLDCGACHAIPGVRPSRGRVGPSLEGFGRRGYIAGQFPNRPPVLVRWVSAAPEMDPRTAMPGFALTEREARDIASYLYTLR